MPVALPRAPATYPTPPQISSPLTLPRPTTPQQPGPTDPDAVTDAVALDSALRLIPPPLAVVARAAAAAAAGTPTAPHDLASAPLPSVFVSVDDLQNMDVPWDVPADLEDMLFADTQYLQLDTAPVEPSSSPVPISSQAQIHQPLSHHPPTQTPKHEQTIPSSAALPSTPRRISQAPAKRPRSRPPSHSPTSMPSAIPIVPRTALPAQPPLKRPNLAARSPNSEAAPKRRNSSSGTARAPLRTTPSPVPRPSAVRPDNSPASAVSRDPGRRPTRAPSPAEQPPVQLNGPFPVAMHPHGMILPMRPDMYPMPPHSMFPQPVAPPSTGAATLPTSQAGTAEHSPPSRAHDTSSPAPANFEKIHVSGNPVSAASATAVRGPAARQPFLAQPMPLVAPGVMPYDPNMMPLLMTQQMYLAAAAAGYPQGIMAPMHVSNPAVAANVFSQFPNMTPPSATVSAENQQIDTRQAAEPPAPRPAVMAIDGAPTQSMPDASPPIAAKDPSLVDLPQQSLARLGRDRRFERLQLHSIGKGKAAATAVTKPGNPNATNTQVGPREVSSKQPAYPSASPAAVVTASKDEPGLQSAEPSHMDRELQRQKKRLVWTPELHERFVKAIDVVGLNQAVPKALVTIMNVEGLTTEHVKSHLQKYRNSLRREAAEDERTQSGVPRASCSAVPGQNSGSTVPAGVNQAGSGVGISSIENVVRQYQILPNRISLFGNPVTTSPAPSGGTAFASQSATITDAAPVGQDANRSVTQTIGIAPAPTGNVGVEGFQGRPAGAGGGQSVPGRLQSQRVASAGPDPSTGVRGVADTQSRIGDQANALSESQAGDLLRSRKSLYDSMDVDAPDAGLDNLYGAVAATGAGGRSLGNAATPGDGKELRLDVINEKTLHMQLQLQMMIHRTLALEKKLQPEFEGKMRGGSNNAGPSTSVTLGFPSEDVSNDRDGDGSAKDDAVMKQHGLPVKNEGKMEVGSAEEDKSLHGQNSGLAREELAALRQDQVILSKQLEAQRELLREKMRGNGDEQSA